MDLRHELGCTENICHKMAFGAIFLLPNTTAVESDRNCVLVHSKTCAKLSSAKIGDISYYSVPKNV